MDKNKERTVILSSLPQEWQDALMPLDVNGTGRVKYSDITEMLQKHQQKFYWGNFKALLLLSFVILFAAFKLDQPRYSTYFAETTAPIKLNRSLFPPTVTKPSVSLPLPLSLESTNPIDKQENPCSTIGIVGPYICVGTSILGVVALDSATIVDLEAVPADSLALLLSRARPQLQISSSIGRFTQLQWFVAAESLRGTVPPQIGELKELTLILMNRNSGFILPFPTELGLVEALVSADFSASSLGGTIASELGSLSFLRRIRMGMNRISGTIPTTLGELSSMQVFSYEINNITGTIPFEFKNLKNLTTFTINYNQMSGSLISELGSLEELLFFDVSHNQFSGQIPSTYFMNQKIKSLNLEDNSFSGQLNIGENRESTNLQFLSIDSNKISGGIPTTIGELSKLTELNLGGNSITGTFPIAICSLTNLVSLKVMNNKLSGSIPTQIGLLKNLKYLDLSGNLFSGSLPSQLGSLEQLTIFTISTNNFVGSLIQFKNTTNITIQCTNSGLDDPNCPKFVKGVFLPDAVFYAMLAPICLSLIILFVIMILFVVNRKVSVIRVSNPLFGLLTILGLVFLVLATITFGLSLVDRPVSERDIDCRISLLFLVIGVVIVFSSISARNYPIWQIFDNPTLRTINLPAAKLARPVLICLLTGLALDIPLLIQLTAIDNHYGCQNTSPLSSVFLTVLSALTFALAAFAFYTCFKIRNVPSKYNDTRNVARATYNLVSFGTAMIILGFATSDATPLFISVTLAVLLGSISFSWSVHGSKLKKIYFPSNKSLDASKKSIDL